MEKAELHGSAWDDHPYSDRRARHSWIRDAVLPYQEVVHRDRWVLDRHNGRLGEAWDASDDNEVEEVVRDSDQVEGLQHLDIRTVVGVEDPLVLRAFLVQHKDFY